MRGYGFLFAKELKLMLKNKSFYIWVLFLPVLFLLIYSRMGRRDFKTKVILIDAVKNQITEEFKERLGREFKVLEGTTKSKGIPIIKLWGDFLLKDKNDTKVKVIFPEDFSEGKKIYLKIAVYKTMAELVAKYRLGIKQIKPFVRLKEKKNKLLQMPWGIRHTLPAIILMFILFNVLTKGVEKFFLYKEQGLIERFSVLPNGVKGVLLFFMLYQVMLAMLSVTIIFLEGVLLFHFSINTKALIYLYLVFFVFSILVSSLSLLVFSLIKKKEAAIGLGVLVANVLCALGGLWWPIEIVPSFFKKLGLALPTGLTMKIIDGIVYYNLSIKDIIPQIGLLIFVSAVLFFISTFVFLKTK